MITIKQGRIARSIAAAGAFGAALALQLGAAQAQDKSYEMKISTPTINDTPDTFARNFLAAVEKDSAGRIKGQVIPGEPARLDSASDRRNAVWLHPM
jgi:TRAP-type C4-dicarboxylate transport system substrate-binding protein